MTVVGDITQNLMGLQALAAGRQELEQREQQASSNRIAQENLRKYQLSSQEGKPDYEALNEAIINSPELSQNVLAGLGIREKRQGLEAADFAVKAASMFNNRPQLMQLVKNRIDYLQSQGRDPKDTIEFAEAYITGDTEGAKNGLKASAAALANQGYLDKDIYSSTFGVGGGRNLGSTKILDDGTTIQATSSGPIVFSASGEQLTGEAAANAIHQAQQYGADIQSQRAGGRTAASLDARVQGGGEAQRVEAEGAGQGKGSAARRQEFIDRGVAAAEGLPTIKRAIQLLNDVPTGGIDKVGIQARQFFGVEGADEGELSYNLGKSVLTQLRETFGAAFTASEGERLQKLEAGLGRNPKTNMRILEQTKKIMEMKAKRGRNVAEEDGDDFVVRDIDEWLNTSLEPQQQGGSGQGANTPVIAPAAAAQGAETAAQRLARLRSGN